MCALLCQNGPESSSHQKALAVPTENVQGGLAGWLEAGQRLGAQVPKILKRGKLGNVKEAAESWVAQSITDRQIAATVTRTTRSALIVLLVATRVICDRMVSEILSRLIWRGETCQDPPRVPFLQVGHRLAKLHRSRLQVHNLQHRRQGPRARHSCPQVYLHHPWAALAFGQSGPRRKL